jgi:hypothetical protein
MHRSRLQPGFRISPILQDVISGYVSNSHFNRDFYPPGLLPGQESPLYGPSFGSNNNGSRQSSMLNVSDPRYSAAYGNPYLRQVQVTAQQ